jgi:uncharacterized protein YndB with AHSA1/START domain
VAPSSSTAAAPAHLLAIERIFDAPRELVFKAWVDPRHLVRRLGSEGFRRHGRNGSPGWRRISVPHAIGQRSRSGNRESFEKVLEPERFVRSCVWADAHNNPTSPETLMTVTFQEYGGRTKLTFQPVFETAAESDAHRIGTASALDRPAEYLTIIA